MEILVKIESGHKPKSTNILPKTLIRAYRMVFFVKKIRVHVPQLGIYCRVLLELPN